LTSDLESLDLIDLISERHQELRKLSEALWNKSSDISISNSEWFILARVYQKEATKISDVTKQVDITRQATHKFIKQLREKGLVVAKQFEDNKKEKSIELTELGKECYEKNEALKAELENHILNQIGVDQVNQLKEMLRLDWGL